MEFAEKAPADRNLALDDDSEGKKKNKKKKKTKPAEERKNIVSNRVQWVEPYSNRIVHFESALEFRAALILASQPGVVAITSQYGPVWYWQEGRWRKHYFDLCVDYANGCRALFAVKTRKRAAKVEAQLELMRNQELHKHADFAELLTEDDITKPAVYRAGSIVRARQMKNGGNDKMLLSALTAAGGRARVFEVLNGLPNTTFGAAWDSMWSLIDQGLVAHDHPFAEDTFIEEHSFIRITRSHSHA